MLKTVKERKKASEARPLMPAATPCTNVEMMSGTDDLRLSDEADAPDWSIPRSFSQPWNLSAAAFDSLAIVSD